MLGIRKIKINN